MASPDTSEAPPRRKTVLLKRGGNLPTGALPAPPPTLAASSGSSSSLTASSSTSPSPSSPIASFASSSSSAPPTVVGRPAPPGLVPATPALSNFGEADNDSNIIFVPGTQGTQHPEVKAATLLKLVERLTYEKYPDPKFLSQFLLTYRSFTDPETLIKLLIDRYSWIPTAESDKFISEKQRPIRLRVYNVLKAWLQNHAHDFTVCKPLKLHMQRLIDEMNKTQMENPALNLQKELRKFTSAGTGSTLSQTDGAPPHLQNAPKSILPKGPVKTILDVNPEELARQITLIEHQLFKEIKANEFLGLAWAKRREQAPNILRLINWSNRMIKWVATTIVTEPDYRRRVATLKLILDTADYCKRLNNFNGVMEIVSGLNSSSCFRLRKTWSALGKTYEQRFEDLKQLVSRDHNFHTFREYLKTKIAPPSIPYMGVYLTDLTFIEEGNNDFTAEGLINFEKRRQVAKVIDDLLSYQKDPYPLLDVVPLQEMLKTARVLNEDDQYTHSHAREKKVGKGETVLVEAGEASVAISEADEFDFGELEQIPGYPFTDKDVKGKNIVFNGTTITAATLPKLIERATPASGHGADIVPVILMTYRRYTSPQQLIEMLRHRFFMPKPLHCTVELLNQFNQKRSTPIRVRTISFLKQWIDKFGFDIRSDPQLKELLLAFLQDARVEPVCSKTCQTAIENINKADPPPPQLLGLFPATDEMPVGQPVGNFLSLQPSEIASHLTYLCRCSYEALNSADFLGALPSPTIEQMTTLSADIRLWIITELVRPKSTGTETLEVFSHILTVAEELLTLKNYLGAHAIFTAFSRVDPTMKALFNVLPAKNKQTFQQLGTLFSPNGSYASAWEAASGAAVPAILLVQDKLNTLMEQPDTASANLINLAKMNEITAFMKSVLNFVKEDSGAAVSASEVFSYLKDATLIDETEIDLCVETLVMPENKAPGDPSSASNVKNLISEALKDPSFRKQMRFELLASIKDDIFRIARQEMTLIGLRAGLVTPKDGRNILLDIVERHYAASNGAMINEWSHSNSEVLGFPHTFVLFGVHVDNQQHLVSVEPHLGQAELSAFLRISDIYKRENSISDLTLVCIASTIEENVMRPAIQAGVHLRAAADESAEPSQVPLECAARFNRTGQRSLTLVQSSPSALPATSSPSSRRGTTMGPAFARRAASPSSSGGIGDESPRLAMRGGLHSSSRGAAASSLPAGGPPQRFLSTTALPRQVPDLPPGRPASGTIDSGTIHIPPTRLLPSKPALPPTPPKPVMLPPPPPKPTVAPSPPAPATPVYVPKKRVASWTTSDVLEWLEAKGFSDLSSIFEENMITGPDLQDLKESDLREELTIEDESLYQPLLAAIAALTEYE